MNVPAPENAPKREDLPYLRRRSRPKGVAVGPSAAKNPALADFLASRSGRRDRTSGTFSRQARPASSSSGLDLSAPESPQPVSTPPDADALVLGIEPTGVGSGQTSLDLSAQPVPPGHPSPGRTAAARPKSETSPERARVRAVARVRSGSNTVLREKAPTVTLTRLQSGVGTLTFEAVCGDAVGDLRLGCAYQLRTGHTSTVQRAEGRPVAGADSARPLIVGERGRYETIVVDLRQCQEIERLVIYGYSENGTELRWDGALVVTTFSGAKIELDLHAEPSAGVGVLLSLYNVRGEFVLRYEMEMISGSIRDACRAYGFDRITWLDAMNPVG